MSLIVYLVGVIGWAKQIPGKTSFKNLETTFLPFNITGFTDLPLNDQMRLLQVSWAEVRT